MLKKTTFDDGGPFHPHIDPKVVGKVAKEFYKCGLVEINDDGEINNRWKSTITRAIFRAILIGALTPSAIKVIVDDMRTTHTGEKGLTDNKLAEAFRKELKK